MTLLYMPYPPTPKSPYYLMCRTRIPLLAPARIPALITLLLILSAVLHR